MDITKLIETVTVLSINFAPKVVAALLIFGTFVFAYRMSRKPLTELCKRMQLAEPITKLLIRTIYKWLLIGFGALMAVKQMGIDVGAVLAGLGVAGIAIGFAAQETVSNIIAGFIIFLDRSFTVGDWLKVGDQYGKVHEITMRSTRLQTEQNTYIIIPNAMIINEVVDNHSKYGALRVDVPVGIAYHESIDEAREVLLKAVNTLPGVLKDPPAEVIVDELDASSVNLQVEVWIEDANEEEPMRDLVLELSKKTLDEAGIEIPFQQIQLHVDAAKQKAIEDIKKDVALR